MAFIMKRTKRRTLKLEGMLNHAFNEEYSRRACDVQASVLAVTMYAWVNDGRRDREDLIYPCSNRTWIDGSDLNRFAAFCLPLL